MRGAAGQGCRHPAHRALPTCAPGGGTSRLQAPPRRATLAEGLLRSGLSFPVCACGGGGRRKLQALGQPWAAAPRAATPRAEWAPSPPAPTRPPAPASAPAAAPVPRVGAARGLAAQPALGGWTLPGVGPRTLGACGAAERRVLSRGPLPRAGQLAGCRLCGRARHAGLNCLGAGTPARAPPGEIEAYPELLAEGGTALRLHGSFARCTGHPTPPSSLLGCPQGQEWSGQQHRPPPHVAPSGRWHWNESTCCVLLGKAPCPLGPQGEVGWGPPRGPLRGFVVAAGVGVGVGFPTPAMLQGVG